MGFKPITYKSAPGEEPHITPEDDAAIYESIVGTDGVFTVGEQFKATVISNNKVRIANGVLNVGGTYGTYYIRRLCRYDYRKWHERTKQK